ncbi:MAG: NUDIX hydrolase [Schleiferiaceae bacterium]
MNRKRLFDMQQRALPVEGLGEAMMPWYRKMTMPGAERVAGAKQAAVLIHVFPSEGDLEVLYMRRPAYDGAHGGQVSFPGGKVESTDGSLLETALREAQEEVGLRAEDLEIVRALSPLYIPPSDFMVHPFVSFGKERPELVLDPTEVAHTFSIPLEALCSDELVGETTITIKTGKEQVPAYLYQDEVIWGATAMMTAEFVALLS